MSVKRLLQILKEEGMTKSVTISDGYWIIAEQEIDYLLLVCDDRYWGNAKVKEHINQISRYLIIIEKEGK